MTKEEWNAALANMSDLEINELMDAIRDRFQERYPEWDVIYMAISKQEPEREKTLNQLISLLKK